MPTIAEQFFDNVDISQLGCWNWKRATDGCGYATITIGATRFTCHRLMWVMFNGSIPKGLLVLHRCDNRKCINPDHLFLGTNADNMKDAAVKNRFIHKLTVRDIIEIRRLRVEGMSQGKIAKIFGLNQSNVSRIISKKRRQHI